MTDEADFSIRPLERNDREWVAHFLDERWATTHIVSRGQVHIGHLLPGFVAERTGKDGSSERIGLITYRLEGNECEIMTLDSVEENHGIGSALVDTLLEGLKNAENIRRVWLITTNDNLEALRFWQKRDFALVAVHRDAIQQARRMKPQIPIIGKHGIPIRDEIELELMLK